MFASATTGLSTDSVAETSLCSFSKVSRSENAVAIDESIYDEMMDALKAEGGYLCNSEEREKLRKAMWPDGKTLNRDIFGRPVAHIAVVAGIDIPEGTKFLMVIGEKIGPEDRFSGEKVSLVLTVWKWNDFNEMLDRLEKILDFNFCAHTNTLLME